MAKFTDDDWTMGELEDVELEELTRQVSEGYHSGHLDDGEGGHIYWELRYNKWQDEEA